jgi:OOP family OmpA-OmpF porin
MTETTKVLRFSLVVAAIALSLAACKNFPPAPPPVAAAPPPAAAPAPAPAPQTRQFTVYFEFDKSNLTPEGSKVVSDAAAYYKQTGSARVAITGYTDLAGTQQYNLGLSKRRADTVRAALVKAGVPDGAIAEAWRGKENPAVPTPDGVREPRNRRVEIVL